MKSLIIFILAIGIGFAGFSQTKDKNTATIKKVNNSNIKEEKLIVKETYTHTFTSIPKSKVKELKIVHPTTNKHVARKLTPQEAAELRKLKEKQKAKQQ